MRALIVDDSRAIRSVISRILRDLGYSVTEAGNGEEALAALDAMADAPALAMVDWNMPVMDGYAFLCRARQDQRYAGTKFMMVTTETELERMQMALAAGADEYLMKPFTREAVADKLAIMGLHVAA